MERRNHIIVLVIMACCLMGNIKVQAGNAYDSIPRSFEDTKVANGYEMPAFYFEGGITSGNNPTKNILFDFHTPKTRWPYESVCFAQKNGLYDFVLNDINGAINYEAFGSDWYNIVDYKLTTKATDCAGRTARKVLKWIYESIQQENDWITIQDATYPETLYIGQSFGLYGLITAQSDILIVTGRILDDSGSILFEQSDYPNTQTYDVNGNKHQGIINVNLAFNELSSGEYIYQLEASDKYQTKMLIEQKFNIIDEERIVPDAANRITCGYGGYGGHKGTDLGCSEDEELNIVYPHSAGTVVDVQSNWSPRMGKKGMASYGNYVVVQHADHCWTRYAHLDSVDAVVGQEVDRNSRLGVIGSTGNVTGRHLHVELITDLGKNTRIDIEPYLTTELP